jgi:hypothetical protein
MSKKYVECPYGYGKNCFGRKEQKGKVTEECNVLDTICTERNGAVKEECPFYKPKNILEKYLKNSKK